METGGGLWVLSIHGRMETGGFLVFTGGRGRGWARVGSGCRTVALGGGRGDGEFRQFRVAGDRWEGPGPRDRLGGGLRTGNVDSS